METNDSARMIRNIGIVAHIDAGKTTLAEQILFTAGRIRQLGRVDQGTSQLDWLPTEKKRGITVSSAATSFSWEGYQINLIDTPGHTDFAGDTWRALGILDGVVIVVSGVEGVEVNTLALWKEIETAGVPALFFINKTDREGSDTKRVTNEIRESLTSSIFEIDQDLSELIEATAEIDDKVLEYFVNGRPIDPNWLKKRMIIHAHNARIFPVITGSALKGNGVKQLLDSIVKFLPPPSVRNEDVLSGVVFKIQRDPGMGRMAFVRMYGGSLSNRQEVPNSTKGITEKVTQIRKIHADTHRDIGEVKAGDIAALCGLKQTGIGDVIGDKTLVPYNIAPPFPVFQVKAYPLKDGRSETIVFEEPNAADSEANVNSKGYEVDQFVNLAEALKELEDEDPNLHVAWNPDIFEITVRVMGLIQVEVLQSILADRFGINAGFAKPTVVFKETPLQSGYGYIHYTSVPHWAILRFLIEPAPRGSGLEYVSLVKPRDIKVRYQREVERRVPLALRQGNMGWEVTDLKVTLVEGSDHEQHTHPLDFIAATGWGVEDGLRNCRTKLLEPILSFEITTPAEIGGRVCNELTMRRAVFEQPLFIGDSFNLRGEIPASTSIEIPLLLQQWSGGKSSVITKFARYDLAPDDYNDDPSNFRIKKAGVSFKGFM